MELSELTAITPLDGRYANKSALLRPIFSEFGLLKQRVAVELAWIQTLAEIPELTEVPPLSQSAEDYISAITRDFNLDDGTRIKTIENTTNHDVKAVEYFIKEKFAQHPELKGISEFVHFGCTSEDINNTAYTLMLKEGLQASFLPQARGIQTTLEQQALTFKDISMLARTHGQAASPTTVGKEWINTCARLKRALTTIENHEFLAKFNGAVGNYNAHQSAYPELNWPEITTDFLKALGFVPNLYTTQIEPHDTLAELFDALSRYNHILIDFCTDVWGYIALGRFGQRSVQGEIGSSTMPHKINPIDFENAEGNLGLANALLTHFSSKLTRSRWQRDLSDSTVMRNLGSAFAYIHIALIAIDKGLNKLEVNNHSLEEELSQNWQVLAEPLQTVMRRYGIANPYEKLKELTRGKSLTQEDLHGFIAQLDLPDTVKKELLALTPSTYVGLAQTLTQHYFQDN